MNRTTIISIYGITAAVKDAISKKVIHRIKSCVWPDMTAIRIIGWQGGSVLKLIAKPRAITKDCKFAEVWRRAYGARPDTTSIVMNLREVEVASFASALARVKS